MRHIQHVVLISAAVLAFSLAQVGVSRAASNMEIGFVAPSGTASIDLSLGVSSYPIISISGDIINPAGGVSPCFTVGM
jgi:hypothetical protein